MAETLSWTTFPRLQSIDTFWPDEITTDITGEGKIAGRSRPPRDIANSMSATTAETMSATTVETIPIDSASPWLPSNLERLARLRFLQSNWESTGAAPPNDIALNQAAQVLRELSEIGLRPLHIDASIDEGVCISFRNGTKYSDVECFNSGDIFAAMADDEQDTKVWEVEPKKLRSAIARISYFLNES